MMRSLLPREIRVLFRKEWAQLTASRSAVATAALLPIGLLGVLPWFTMLATATPSGAPSRPLPPGLRVGLLAEVEDPRQLAAAVLPILVAMVGLVLPTIMATHLLITERERRTLELLIALPVRVEQVLIAKLLATLLASSAITVPLLAIDVAALTLRGQGELSQLLPLPLVLVAALGLSTSAALLVALLAKDFRTANNLVGALLGPMIIVTLLVSIVLPGGATRPIVIAVIYSGLATLLFRHALRTVTFERLLS